MKILIIDDDRTVCSSLLLLLAKKGYQVEAIHSPQLALEKVNAFQPNLILLDMNFTIDTSGKQGIELLKRIQSSGAAPSIILMTGWATVQLAVKGMKLGARDFIAKPWDNKDLLASIKSILELDNHTQSDANVTAHDSRIIGSSDLMKEVMDMVSKVAPTEASVLITGESGTGKELIAEAIHEKSKRQENPFIKVNLGSIPESLFESEMFGHIKGAFTGAEFDRVGRFEKSHEGTIFLDEIGELTLNNQVKMLRVLQEKTFEKLGSSQTQRINVRVISATNRDLQEMAYSEKFREDLFYRINLINIHLPPLRERRSDIVDLVRYFVKNVTNIYGIDQHYIDDETLTWLSRQSYPGNIRQLKNIVESSVLLNLDKQTLSSKEFMKAFERANRPRSNTDTLDLKSLEIDTIKRALAKYNNSISQSSKALGITRSSLYRRLEKYNIMNEPEA